MKMKGNLISLISAIFIVLVGVAMTGCMPALHTAIGKGDSAAVKEQLDKGADVNERRPIVFLTPLMDAATMGNLEIVKMLVERGADVNALGASGLGSSPLGHAAEYGPHKEVIKFLVDKGADIDKAIWALKKATNVDKKRNQLAIEYLQEYKKSIAAVPMPSDLRVQAEHLLIIKSDIDELPSVKAKPNKNAYAIVIGIEQYRQKLPKADYAVADAKTVTEYLTKVMGYPEENVITLLNDHASNVDLVKYFEKWLPNNVENGGSVFVYYSGHGAPDPKSGSAYLVPYDGDPSFIDETGYSLKRMYTALGKLPAKEVIVALDSCFSGAGGRSVLAKGARPLVMNLQNAVALPSNMIVMSASSGEQVSSTYDEKGHGLFTYFMLKGIKNEDIVKQDGSLDINELHSYLKPQVERIARKQYNNEQTPQLIAPKKN